MRVKEVNRKDSKRKSCLLLTLISIIILAFGVYFISKEVSDAFIIVDKGLEKSNLSIHKSNEALKNVLIQNEIYRPIIQDIENTSSNFSNFIDSTIHLLIVQSGGWKENSDESELAYPRITDIPTQILVSNGLGEKIEQKIIETSSKYYEVLHIKLNADSLGIPLEIDRNHMKETGKTWAEFHFDQMPIMAVLPILRKFKNDENESKAIIYRHIANEQLAKD